MVAVTTGLMEAVVCPLLHTYVVPPDAVRETELPLHTVVAPAMAAVGCGAMLMVATAVLEQLFALVTVTVKEVAVVGLGLIVAVVAPVFHKYVPPPFAVSVAVCPLQMDWFPPALAVGKEFTVTTATSVAVHPKPLVTVTE